ncbi:Na+/H+ antiporter subunit C [Hydrogenophilus thermoluteolus]|nr:Na+/H+ antiporter subunit C [Hydrogenophilus thermoluteolus]MBW7656337.1 Na+/H+ antiporter subunit C [Hydrogenophilus thermoluteolus]
MTLEGLVASAIGIVTTVAVYLLLQPRAFATALGLTLLSYAVNMFIFVAGGLWIDAPPVLDASRRLSADPLPQALILTAIVIGFATTAYLLALAVRRFAVTGDERTHLTPKHTEDAR